MQGEEIEKTPATNAARKETSPIMMQPYHPEKIAVNDLRHRSVCLEACLHVLRLWQLTGAAMRYFDRYHFRWTTPSFFPC